MGSIPASSGVGPSAEQPPPGGRGDHRPVVGAELTRREKDPPPAARPPSPRPARASASSRPPRRRSPPSARPTSSATAKSLSTSWSTTASWNDAATSATRRVGRAADVVHDRGLQAGEGEVGLAAHRTREAHRRGIAGASRAGRSRAHPGSRARGTGRPCRTLRPRRRRPSGPRRGSARGPPSRRSGCGLPTRSARRAAAPASALRATPRRDALRGGSHPRTEGRP